MLNNRVKFFMRTSCFFLPTEDVHCSIFSSVKIATPWMHSADAQKCVLACALHLFCGFKFQKLNCFCAMRMLDLYYWKLATIPNRSTVLVMLTAWPFTQLWAIFACVFYCLVTYFVMLVLHVLIGGYVLANLAGVTFNLFHILAYCEFRTTFMCFFLFWRQFAMLFALAPHSKINCLSVRIASCLLLSVDRMLYSKNHEYVNVTDDDTKAKIGITDHAQVYSTFIFVEQFLNNVNCVLFSANLSWYSRPGW